MSETDIRRCTKCDKAIDDDLPKHCNSKSCYWWLCARCDRLMYGVGA